MTWFINNLGTIFISLLLILIVAMILNKLIKDKKAGKSSCGCNCAHCGMAGSCHKTK